MRPIPVQAFQFSFTAPDTKAIEEAYRAANAPMIDDPLELLK
ncbi:hypothetical protein [Deinococcus cavernae]|nr:hypothetical protein [Deinococcus cavernae]